MRTALVAGGAALAAAAAPVATQIFSQSEAAAVYTSAAVSNHGAPGATLAFADWLNPPIFVGAFNATTGNPVFQYTASSSSTVFQVDTARHAEAAGKGCVVRGWVRRPREALAWDVRWRVTAEPCFAALH